MSGARKWVPVKFSRETLVLFLRAWASRPRPKVGQNWGTTSPEGLTLSLYPLSYAARAGLRLGGCSSWVPWLAMPSPTPHPTLSLLPWTQSVIEPLRERVLIEDGVLL